MSPGLRTLAKLYLPKGMVFSRRVSGSRSGRANILLLRYFPAHIAISSHDKDTLILQGFLAIVAVDQLGKGCMALYKEVRVQWHIKALTELRDTIGFMLAAAVGEEDEGDVVGLEITEGFLSARERLGAAD